MASRSRSLLDQVIVITGASSGIGEATALHLAGRGAKLVLGARRVDRLESIVQRIKSAGGNAVAVITDVTEHASVANLIRSAAAHFGRIDVLVNNAGVMPISALDQGRVDDWNDMIDVNIKGVLYGIAAALPLFRAQERGHFINIASTAAHRVVPNMSVYCATKFAVRATSEGLRQEAGDKLRVTIISPGFTKTSFAENVTDEHIRCQLQASSDKIGMPPEAIAAAIAFAIEQPNDVDVNENVIRSTAQS